MNPDLERTIVLAAEAAIRGRKAYTTAEDIRQEMRVQLLRYPAILDSEPAHLYTQLKWIGTLYAKSQQAQCITSPSRAPSSDRWNGIAGMTGEDAAKIMAEAGYQPEPDDLRTIVEAVDARMDWTVLAALWGVTDKAAYTRFRRASERVVLTRVPATVRERTVKEKNVDQPEAGQAVLVGGPDDGKTITDPGDGKIRMFDGDTSHVYRRMSLPDKDGRTQFAHIGEQGSNTAAPAVELDQPGRDRAAKMGVQEVAEDPTITAIRNSARGDKAEDTGPEVEGAQAADLNVASKELQSGAKASSKK